MASLLRQIVAGPRAPHPEANLDLCYVTDNIIATSGPSGTYPQVAYRNPLKDLVKFLDHKHGDQWAIWEFRAEGTGYPDSEVYGRIFHYPWPDHHPPPFALLPLITGSMRNWMDGAAGSENKSQKPRAIVVHCKAGKGRSGTSAISYLISEEGWTMEDALKRFTERRMRPGFGAGVSIPSQLRWIGYVDRWAKHGKKYLETPLEILEVHVWGLRDGVKVCVEGFIEEGRVIKQYHTFTNAEREMVRGELRTNSGLTGIIGEVYQNEKPKNTTPKTNGLEQSPVERTFNEATKRRRSPNDLKDSGSGDTVFRPTERILLETNDVNIDFERRNKATYGLSMVTSVAHVWFNAFFEGNGPEQDGHADKDGVFEMEWDAMDGIKGSSRKGTRAFDRLAVVWKSVQDDRRPSIVINQPTAEEGIKQTQPADWRGRTDQAHPHRGSKELGLRNESPAAHDISRASSTGVADRKLVDEASDEEENGIRAHGPDGEGDVQVPKGPLPTSEYLPGPKHEVEQ